MNDSGSNSSDVANYIDATPSAVSFTVTIVCLGVIFTLLAVVLTYWTHYGLKRKFSQQISIEDQQKSTILIRKPNNELLSDFKKFRAIDSENFRQQLTSVESKNAEVNRLIDFLQNHSTDEEQKLSAKNFYLPYRKLCRIPWIPCYFSQSFAPFHCNLVLDFYNFPLYLCSAPTLSEIADFWNFILAQKIGIVVIISNGGNDSHSDIYTPIVENTTKIYGITKIRFIHCHGISPTNESQELKTLLTSISNSVAQTSKDFLRNGILLQDATGLEESVVLAAAHIGLQTLQSSGQISVLALCQYIRRYRFGALTFSPKLQDLVTILFHLLASNYLIDA
uniref:Tyrosine-protein phosphatase domain-containing protein n=1 Tax=Romanomermis culicivorax TaxID=13658 RepID=A0A915KIP8_ROMCU